MGAVENLREDAAGVVTFLILGAGFAALFAGIEWFWMIWVIGFAVLLPLVGIALGEEDEEPDDDESDEEESALERLKRRYAAGELTDEEFERRLERLLETEDIDAAEAYVERARREREAE